MADSDIRVAVDGQHLRLTNLDKVLYPHAGFTKADVIDYYTAVADALLPRLAGRPVTLRRYPDGVAHPGFFEKNISRHAPEWVRTARLATPGSTTARQALDFVLVEDRRTLVWAANLAAVELHVPQWRVQGQHERGLPDLLVFDLDPGDAVGIVECCRVAEWIRERVAADGLTLWPKTSGSKGLQLYAPVRVDDPAETADYARSVAKHLADEHPELVVSSIARAARTGKVLIDWSQNNPGKTTIAAYSLRARPDPTVSTPVTWAEIESCRAPEDLRHTASGVRERLTTHGDLFAGLGEESRPLPRP